MWVHVYPQTTHEDLPMTKLDACNPWWENAPKKISVGNFHGYPLDSCSVPAPPAFDAQAWVNASGDPQKTVYGFGVTKEAENIHKQVIPSSTKKTTFHSSISANNESEIAELKRENVALKASVE
ncbi:hypothetical protein Tco_0876249 [Tanacetum coccineum]|uniref:Uncharacterized protein n=1 Tax=Tanacetum coccineum TaxID=301880 RepID=A0ABQ5BTA2_9ASTR